MVSGYPGKGSDVKKNELSFTMLLVLMNMMTSKRLLIEQTKEQEICMNNKQSKLRLLILMVSVNLTLLACNESPLTPSETVQHFWAALLSGEVTRAQQYVTRESLSELQQTNQDFSETTVSFGKINLESNRATIETTLTKATMTDQRTVTVATTFQTVLDKQDKLWRVNYIATRKSLDDSKRKKGLSKLVDDLEELGRDVKGQLGGVLENWEKVTPKIKQDLEELGNSMQKQLQDSIDKHGPEVQEKLQEFTESLDDVLKDLEKSVPETEKSSEEEDPKARMI